MLGSIFQEPNSHARLPVARRRKIEDSLSHQAADPLTVYCPACNEAFLGRLNDSHCPRCGMVAFAPDQMSLQTIILGEFDDSRSGMIAGTPCEEDDLDCLVGQELDRYSVENFLGKGGMGWVFLARHLHLNRPCALKILTPSLTTRDPDYVDRFYTEGQAAAALIHPNIVTIHAIGRHETYHFLEMEYVGGRSLQRMLGQVALMPLRAAALALGVSNGLAAAHRVGIIHRDLKPDNVLLSHTGIPKIADFGLAKRLHGKARYELPGTLAGTPHFMAPELFLGEDASPASDVYALGVTLYVMLTGHVPFTAESLESLARKVQQDAPPSIRTQRPDVPLELAECLGLLMEKSPANRPRDGIEASQLLQAILGHTRDLESLLYEAFHNEPSVGWRSEGTRYQAKVTLPDGRRQTVFLETSNHELGERLLQIYSLCCPASTEYHADALRLNSAISHGAVALRNVDGQEYFVTLNNYPRATVDAEEIRRSVLEIAMRADAVECRLTGDDRH